MKRLGHNNYFSRLSGDWHLPICNAPQTSSSDKQTALFNTLFSMDDDGFVHDALGKALSDDVRPEISEYIRNILMRPYTPVGRNSLNLSDDDIANLSPNIGESVEDYQSRVMTFLKPEETKDD